MTPIHNESRYPEHEVAELVRFAIDRSRVDLAEVKVLPEALPDEPTKPPGRGWVDSLADGTCRITVMPKSHSYLRDYNGPEFLRGSAANPFPVYAWQDWRESLVHLVAHECEHVAGERDESRCERAAVATLEAYRAERTP